MEEERTILDPSIFRVFDYEDGTVDINMDSTCLTLTRSSAIALANTISFLLEDDEDDD